MAGVLHIPDLGGYQSLWSSYFETEVRYSGISFVYHVPSFLVAGMVPTICTLLINYGKGDTIYVGIYSTVVALISAACALALKVDMIEERNNE